MPARSAKGAPAPPPLTIAVAGATGRQGGAVARALLARGHRVRALTRTPSRASELALAGAEVLQVDLCEPERLAWALEGADGFFLVTTPFDKGVDAPNYADEVKQGSTALRVAKVAGTPHVVLSSAHGDGEAISPVFHAKAKIEREATRLRLPVSIVRPAAFMENLLSPWAVPMLRRGTLRWPAQPTDWIYLVAVADVGALAQRLFERREEAVGRTVDLVGDALTVGGMAGALGAALGRRIEFVADGTDTPRPSVPEDGATTSPPRADPLAATRALEKEWKLHLTRLREFLEAADLTVLQRAERRTAAAKGVPSGPVGI